MKFLVDECLSTEVADLLRSAGHDVVHVLDLGLLGRPDAEVMAAAVAEDRVLVSADTDFGELLASGGASLPSLILLRRRHDAAGQAASILGALPDVEVSLMEGAVVVITADRVRVRDLPIR